MVKSSVGIPPTVKRELEYPLLAKSHSSGDIYLMRNLRDGVKLVCGGGVSTIKVVGDLNERMIPITDSSNWEILPKGSIITLTQE